MLRFTVVNSFWTLMKSKTSSETSSAAVIQLLPLLNTPGFDSAPFCQLSHLETLRPTWTSMLVFESRVSPDEASLLSDSSSGSDESQLLHGFSFCCSLSYLYLIFYLAAALTCCLVLNVYILWFSRFSVLFLSWFYWLLLSVNMQPLVLNL